MKTDAADLEARIVELEIRFTHQEALVQTLNELVREQYDMIEGLRRRLGALQAQMSGDDSGG